MLTLYTVKSSNAVAQSNQLDRIRRYFDDRPNDFRVVGPLSAGRSSFAARVKEVTLNPAIRQPRQFVVKRSFREQVQYPEDDATLQKEIDVTDRLRGMPHIAQPVWLNPDPLYGLSRPSLVIEYVENGTLRGLLARVMILETLVPNRVLLGFFCCLLRMTIAMAWPDRRPRPMPPLSPDLPLPNERFPDDWRTAPRAQWVHGDMSLSNILIGNNSPLEGEHVWTPILKLIDFGSARVEPDPNNIDLGIKTNIYDIGRIMRILMTHDDEWDPAPDTVTVRINGTDRTFATAAASLWPASEWPNLDPDLCNIVMLCQAVDPADRPSLDVLSSALEQQAATKDGAWYRNQNYVTWRVEATRNMQLWINEMIFDA